MKSRHDITTLMLTAVIALSACSGDDGKTGGDIVVPAAPDDTLELVSATRAATLIDGDDAPVIQVYLTYQSAGTATWSVLSGDYAYYAGKWNGNFGVKNGQQYYIYGYAPATAATCTLSSNDYSTGVTMQLTGVNAVTADDLCVIVGVQQVDDETQTPDVTEGRFGFMGRGKDNDTHKNLNYACLKLDHILASINFKIRVAEEYHALRTIRLKRMELDMSGGETVDLTVTIAANATGASPITGVSATITNGSQNAVLLDDEEGLELSTAPVEIPGFFWPDQDKQLTLTAIYDVYDKKGTRVRENCTATNTIDISTLKDSTTGQPLQTGIGKQATVSLTVRPTYLYQLSDPELDNPTISIE